MIFMNKRFKLYFLFLFFMPTAQRMVFAASGTNGATFLNIPVGAGPAALGGAYSALATNAYAPVWNPAGLAYVSGVELAGQHLSYLQSIYDEYLGLAIPLGPRAGALGVSAQYLGSGNIDGAALDGTPQGSYSSSYGAYTLAYAHKISDNFALGVAGKMLEAKLADVSAQAFAADAGFLYKPWDRVTFGGGLSNAGSKLTFIDQGDPLPLTGKLAVAVEPIKHVLVAAEGDFPKSDSASGHFGVQWKPISFISLRAGYQTAATKELGGLNGFSAGAGLTVLGQEFSYAYVPYGDLGSTQYFSLLLRWGASDEARQNMVQEQDIKPHRQAGHAKEKEDPEREQLMQLLNSGTEKAAQKKATTPSDPDGVR
jgi:hypothetical protein